MRLTAVRWTAVTNALKDPSGFRWGCACLILLMAFRTVSLAADTGNVDTGGRASGLSAAGMARLEYERIQQVGLQVMEAREFRSVRRHVLHTPRQTDADRGFLRQWLMHLSELVDAGMLYIGDVFRRLLDMFSSDQTQPSAPAAVPSASGGISPSSVWSRIITILGAMAAFALAISVVAAMLKKRDLRRTRTSPSSNEDFEEVHNSGTAPGEIEVSVRERRAVRLAGEGDFRAAIRELLLGSMSWIERAGLIRYQRGLTSRDYLRALSRKPGQRDSFQVTAEQFDRLYFGRKPASRDGFEMCLNGFREAFGESQEPITAG